MKTAEKNDPNKIEDLRLKEMLKRFETDIKLYKSEIEEYREKLLSEEDDATSRYTKKLIEESEKTLKVVQAKANSLKENMKNSLNGNI